MDWNQLNIIEIGIELISHFYIHKSVQMYHQTTFNLELYYDVGSMCHYKPLTQVNLANKLN